MLPLKINCKPFGDKSDLGTQRKKFWTWIFWIPMFSSNFNVTTLFIVASADQRFRPRLDYFIDC